MKISVIGLGWYGEPLALELLLRGHEVLGTSTRIDKVQRLKDLKLEAFLLESPAIPEKELLESDVIILNIPPFEHQLEWLKRWPWTANSLVIFISSTSVLSKTSEVLTAQEEWVQTKFQRWNVLRFAGLIGPDRHPGKFLSGRKNLSHPLWPVNLLHLEDAVGLTVSVINKQIENKVINIVCDEHHSRFDFYTEYAQRMNIPLPEFDTTDRSHRLSISGAEAEEVYTFKWNKLYGREL